MYSYYYNVPEKVMMMKIVIIKFFIYLYTELKSRWPITESARIYTTTAIRQKNDETKRKQ